MAIYPQGARFYIKAAAQLAGEEQEKQGPSATHEQPESVQFPREMTDEIGEFIAERARVCGGGAFDFWEALCERFGAPASAATLQHDAEVSSFSKNLTRQE